MKNDGNEKQEPSGSVFRKPSDSDINIDLPNSQYQLDFKLNELGDFEDIIQNKSVKGSLWKTGPSLGRRMDSEFKIA
jgi:hypothetical protein